MQRSGELRRLQAVGLRSANAKEPESTPRCEQCCQHAKCSQARTPPVGRGTVLTDPYSDKEGASRDPEEWNSQQRRGDGQIGHPRRKTKASRDGGQDER